MKVTQESLRKGLKKCKLLEQDEEFMKSLEEAAQAERDQEDREYWLEVMTKQEEVYYGDS